MNFRVDVMIVGDSKSGHEVLDKLATAKSALKIAFISQAFKSTTTHDYINVQYFKYEVSYVSYRHGLFCCYLKNGDHIFSTHLVIASGLDYAPLIINNEQVPCIFNTIEDVPKAAKEQTALVICNQASDAKFALEVAKKYQQVFICTTALDIAELVTTATSKKLVKTENLTILPNTTIKAAISEQGVLQKVKFDNYSEINCSAIFVKTASKPAIDFVPRKILAREEGYPVATENCESTLVPGCFVVGNCLKKCTKAMEQKLVETILKDF